MRSDEQALQALQIRLGYHFQDLSLLVLALTHRSAGKHHNQRLEFLGDAILGFVVADALYQRHPDAPEGELSQQRAALVNRDTLASLARQLAIGELVVLGLGERKSGGRQRDSILCDAMEAIFGAIYLDGGSSACRECILSLLDDRIADEGLDGDTKDPKTRLQEMMQARGLTLPVYTVVAIDGEEHNQEFDVECRIPLSNRISRGRGRSRRVAEQNAARAALKRLLDEETQDKG